MCVGSRFSQDAEIIKIVPIFLPRANIRVCLFVFAELARGCRDYVHIVHCETAVEAIKKCL